MINNILVWEILAHAWNNYTVNKSGKENFKFYKNVDFETLNHLQYSTVGLNDLSFHPSNSR
jgi:hypothetical protein